MAPSPLSQYALFLTGLVLLPVIIYIVLFIRLGIRFAHQAGRTTYSDNEPVLPVVSVIIACRNESGTIESMLSDLSAQTYPRDRFEVILVDDHSSENEILSPKILSEFDLPGRTLILDGDKGGKKQALIAAAKNSKGQILLFTDADCRARPGWIAGMVAEISHQNADMIIGCVDYLPKTGFLQALFRLDLLSMVMTGISMASLNHPVICNGANMAVRAEVYHSFMDRMVTDIPTGDDVFLLHALKKEGKTIDVTAGSEMRIYTAPPENFKSFLQQRIRWASKSKYYRDPDTIITGLVVLWTNVVYAIALLFLFSEYLHGIALLVVVAKLMTDMTFIAIGLKYLGNRWQMLISPAVILIYPVYLVVTLMAGLRGKYTWKDRLYG